jgi:hypothetical protein
VKNQTRSAHDPLLSRVTSNLWMQRNLARRRTRRTRLRLMTTMKLLQ